ncbi:TPA: hypothetical protein KNG84_002539 [Serratia fonticola]|nr:hypothetical protein [Serratia fonticola]
MMKHFNRYLKSAGCLLDLFPSTDYTKFIDKRPIDQALADDIQAVSEDMWTVFGSKQKSVNCEKFIGLPSSAAEDAKFIPPL